MEGVAHDAPAGVEHPAFKLHWHVVLTHFPVAGFAGAFLFMGLHLLTRNPCFALGAYVTLIAAGVALVPTTLTGWFTWKRGYEGYRSKLFLVKIWTSAVMIPVAAGLIVYQTVHPFRVLDLRHDLPHLIYFLGVLLLMLGAMTEGYWGGRLHHR